MSTSKPARFAGRVALGVAVGLGLFVIVALAVKANRPDSEIAQLQKDLERMDEHQSRREAVRNAR